MIIVNSTPNPSTPPHVDKCASRPTLQAPLTIVLDNALSRLTSGAAARAAGLHGSVQQQHNNAQQRHSTPIIEDTPLSPTNFKGNNVAQEGHHK